MDPEPSWGLSPSNKYRRQLAGFRMTNRTASFSCKAGFALTNISMPALFAACRNIRYGWFSGELSAFLKCNSKPVAWLACWICPPGRPPFVGNIFTPQISKNLCSSRANDSDSASATDDTLSCVFGADWKRSDLSIGSNAFAWPLVKRRISCDFCNRSFVFAASAFASSACLLASAARSIASAASFFASLIRRSASVFVRLVILSFVTVSAAPASTVTAPAIVTTQKAIVATVSNAGIDPHIAPPLNLSLVFGMGLLCLVALAVATILCVWRYRRLKSVLKRCDAEGAHDE